MAQGGLVPRTFREGGGEICCQGGNDVFNPHATCGNAMALAMSSHPWAGAGVCTRVLLPEETEGTARTGRGLLVMPVTWQSMQTDRWLSSSLPVSACIYNFLATLELEPAYVGMLWCK